MLTQTTQSKQPLRIGALLLVLACALLLVFALPTVSIANADEGGDGGAALDGEPAPEDEPETEDISSATVDAIPGRTYTGKALMPKPVVRVGDSTLAEGVDYKLAYANNTSVGTATITITGIGAYSGETSVQFQINAAPSKWVKNSKGWRYDNGDGTWPKNALKTIGGKTYGFNASGYMVTGWAKISGNWYWFNSSGVMKTGWVKTGGKWYYLDKSSGAMKTGWLSEGGKKYYLRSSGAMATDWAKVGGSWYWFNSSGAMKTGWVKTGGKWYYLDPSTGAMKTGWLDQGGKWYRLTSSGAMATGWAKVGSNWYFFNNSGVMKTGWVKSSGNWFYLDSSGKMLTGWQTINGKKYYLDPGLGWIDGHKKEMSNKAQGYASATGYLILVDISHCRVAVFQGWQGHWSLQHYWSCTCGTSATPTITGVYTTGYHLGALPKYPEARFCTHIVGGYFFHTTLGSDSELGHYLSHGCVRLSPSVAQWIYYNIPQGTKVVLYW